MQTLPILGFSQFAVRSSQFAVRSSQFAVRSSQFVVIVSGAAFVLERDHAERQLG